MLCLWVTGPYLSDLYTHAPDARTRGVSVPPQEMGAYLQVGDTIQYGTAAGLHVDTNDSPLLVRTTYLASPLSREIPFPDGRTGGWAVGVVPPLMRTNAPIQ